MIKLLSLFSGIGAFEKALTKLGVDYELTNYCEIDKYASKSYSVIHDVSEELNLWDITKIDRSKLKYADLISYGFPCQDVSQAGHKKGLFNEDGSFTRSGLFFSALDVIDAVKPKIAIAENVRSLLNKHFHSYFEKIIHSLDSIGYNNYYAILNAKDYGIPQQRARVFIVSIRKDIDKGNFEFPKPIPLQLKFIDMLFSTDVELIGEKALNTMLKYMPNEYNPDLCPTLTCELDHKWGKNVYPRILYCMLHYNIKPRFLTIEECFCLMGFTKEDADKVIKYSNNSKSRIFKQLGNSIVVNVLEHLLKNVMKIFYEEGDL